MEILNTVLQLVVLGFTVEAVVETLKLLFVKGKISFPAVTALASGIVLALTVNFDLLVTLGFEPIIPFVGVVLTGLLMSRGGNFIHEWFRKVRGEQPTTKLETLHFGTNGSIETGVELLIDKDSLYYGIAGKKKNR